MHRSKDVVKSYAVFSPKQSFLEVFYLLLVEAVGIASLVFWLPVSELLIGAVVMSLLTFVAIMRFTIRSDEKSSLIHLATGWYIECPTNDDEESGKRIKSNSPQLSRQPLQVLPRTMIYSQIILVKGQLSDGSHWQQVFWIDSLGDTAFRMLSRLLKQSLL